MYVKRWLVTLSITLVIGFGLIWTAGIIVNADTTKLEAELGGYDNIFKLSEVYIGDKKLNVYEMETLDSNKIEQELNKLDIELVKDKNEKHNLYNLVYGGEVMGRILINDYVTSLNLKGDKIKVLGGIGLSGETCKKELEYILNYDEGDESTWYGTLNNGSTSYDWCIDLGDEIEDKALGFIYNENDLQEEEYRIRFGFDKEGNVVELQFNMFHGKE